MTEPPPLIHPTYRHLARPIRLAGLTITQWTLLATAVAAAWVTAALLPFSTTYNLSLAVTRFGTPSPSRSAPRATSRSPTVSSRAHARDEPPPATRPAPTPALQATSSDTTTHQPA